MTRLAVFLTIVLLVGCEDNSEVNRLRREVETLRDENASMKASLPSERPKVLKELEEAMKANATLQREVIALQQTLDQKAGEIPKEVLPLAKMIGDLKERLETLEKTAARKGHTHEYEDSCPIGTFNTRTKITGTDK